MEGDSSSDTFANRDDPIPVLKLPDPNSRSPPATSSDAHSADSRRFHWKSKTDGTNVPNASSAKSSLQDRLLAKLLQQVVPTGDADDGDDEAVFSTPQKPSAMVQRPGFSLPTMTTNFRRFNARIGVVFVFQKRVERLLTWRTPSHTLSLLAILTFICLNPYLLAVLLPACIVLFIMVPAFLVRHPPPPTTTIPNTTTTYSLTGPPLAPATTIKPAGEMSKDFFRNMRDLQNSMEDFAVLHDLLVRLMTPYTNFGNERTSSALFVVLVVGSCALLLFSHLFPWRFFALVTSWTVIASGHPLIQSQLLQQSQWSSAVSSSSSSSSSPPSSSSSSSPTNPLSQLRTLISSLTSHLIADITLTSPPQTAECEIFELHRRQRGEYIPWIFSPNPYDPLSPARISSENGGRPKGTRFFDDVVPPAGWEWVGKKWELDLDSRGWVDERMVQSVVVEEEGERWVVDLRDDDDDDDDDHDDDGDVDVGYDDDDNVIGEGQGDGAGTPRSGLNRRSQGRVDPNDDDNDDNDTIDNNHNHEHHHNHHGQIKGGWEVRNGKLVGGIEKDNLQQQQQDDGRRRRHLRSGEWRRRRWIRVVRRKALSATAAAAGTAAPSILVATTEKAAA